VRLSAVSLHSVGKASATRISGRSSGSSVKALKTMQTGGGQVFAEHTIG
jgi:hypothetical protein